MSPRERPIPFSGRLVRAILADQKSVTRRVIEKIDAYKHVRAGDRLWVRETWQADFGQTFSDHERALWHEMPRSLRTLKAVQRGQGMLYYAADRSVYHAPTPEQDEFGPEVRRSTWEPTEDFWADLRWQPSIFMPRWASRILLEVAADPHVERIQEITEEDAIREGIDEYGHELHTPEERDHRRNTPAIEVFRALWESIHGEGAWDRNDWVWRIAFRRLP